MQRPRRFSQEERTNKSEGNLLAAHKLLTYGGEVHRFLDDLPVAGDRFQVDGCEKRPCILMPLQLSKEYPDSTNTHKYTHNHSHTHTSPEFHLWEEKPSLSFHWDSYFLIFLPTMIYMFMLTVDHIYVAFNNEPPENYQLALSSSFLQGLEASSARGVYNQFNLIRNFVCACFCFSCL